MGYYTFDTVANTSTGTITADAGTVDFGANQSNWSNAGTLQAINGGTMNVGGTANWSALGGGTLTANSGGILNIGGNFTEAELALTTVHGAGGTLNLTGDLAQTSIETLPTPASGIFRLNAGTITGGTVTSAALTFGTSGLLSGVTMSGNFTLPAGAAFTTDNGTIFSGGTTTIDAGGNTISVDGTNTGLTIASTGTLTGLFSIWGSAPNAAVINNGTLAYTGASFARIFGQNYAGFSFTNNNTVTSTGGGELAMGYYLNDTVTNASGGTITADGGTLDFGANQSNWSNAGTLQAINNGTLNVGGTANWSALGAGALTANSGGILNIGGNFTEAELALTTVHGAGGTLNLTGDLTQTSIETLPTPASGIYRLSTGTIAGGTVTSGALTFGTSGFLIGVTASGNFTLPAGSAFTTDNGTIFSGGTTTFDTGGNTISVDGTNTGLTIGSTDSWTGLFSIWGASTNATVVNNGTLTHAGSSFSRIYGQNYTGFSFTNNHVITSNGGGELAMGYYVNDTVANASTGTITADGAILDFGSNQSNWSNAGTLQAINNGTLNVGGTANWSVLGGGTLTANSGGILNIGGNFTEAELALTTVNGSTGTLNLTGNLSQTSIETLPAPVTGIYRLNTGSITGGTVNSGALTFGTGGLLSGVNVSGNFTLPAGASFATDNGTMFTGGTTTFDTGGNTISVDGTNTGLTIASSANWTGLFAIWGNAVNATVVNQGSLDHSSSSFSRIYGQNYTNFSFTNQGTLISSALGTLDVGYYVNDTITNAPGGLMEANGGTLDVGTNQSNLTNLTLTTLTGGTWEATNSGLLTIDSPTYAVVTNDATIVLNGSGSMLKSGPALTPIEQTLMTNNGTLEVLGARNFAATSAGFTNNGTIQLGGGTLSAPSLTNGSGSTLSGFGTFSPTGGVTIGSGVTISPGNASAGNYVNTLTFNSVTLGNGGIYTFDVANAGGTAGTGFDTVNVTGSLNVTASSFTINLESINTGTGLPGTATFNSATSYQWTLISSAGLSGFSAGDFSINLSAFTNGLGGGSFSVANSGNSIVLDFTPVPEPSTWALMAAGAAAIGIVAWRRRIARA